MGPENDDTVVYVGEGWAGANESDDLLILRVPGGVLMNALPVESSPRGNGYEQVCILQRVKVRLFSSG